MDLSEKNEFVLWKQILLYSKIIRHDAILRKLVKEYILEIKDNIEDKEDKLKKVPRE